VGSLVLYELVDMLQPEVGEAGTASEKVRHMGGTSCRATWSSLDKQKCYRLIFCVGIYEEGRT
jgi:hypothetical protein